MKSFVIFNLFFKESFNESQLSPIQENTDR